MRGTQTKLVAVEDLRSEAEALRHAGGRIRMAYAWRPEGKEIELRYLASTDEREGFALWLCRPSGSVPSLAGIWPLIGWYEREIMDLYEVSFDDHPEPYPLVLREGQTRPNGSRRSPDERLNGRPHMPEIGGSDVQELPFGPVRADVVESAEFTFLYVGEHIIHYQPRLFFKHRGMEMRFEGLRPELAVVLAERVSGVGSVAHALAYCEAVERAANCEAPIRARQLRVLLAELERLYNHLHYLGHLCHTTTLKVGEAQGKLLEERAKQINARLTGSRFLRSILIPGGLRRDLAPGAWLRDELESLRVDIVAYIARLEHSDSHFDRLITTGILSRQVAFDQGATGPVARASGLARDLRSDRPYAAYEGLSLTVPLREEGDAYARERVRFAEIESAIAIVQRILLLLPEGEVRTECIPEPLSEGLGWTEGPRGSLYYAVHIARDGTLARVKIKSPSFSNWRAFPFTVHHSNMMDYAINEASFGLTVAGCDR